MLKTRVVNVSELCWCSLSLLLKLIVQQFGFWHIYFYFLDSPYPKYHTIRAHMQNFATLWKSQRKQHRFCLVNAMIYKECICLSYTDISSLESLFSGVERCFLAVWDSPWSIKDNIAHPIVLKSLTCIFKHLKTNLTLETKQNTRIKGLHHGAVSLNI